MVCGYKGRVPPLSVESPRDDPDLRRNLGVGKFVFGNEFRHLTYHQPVDGGDGGSVPANEAAKKAASAVGTTTASLADGISSGMQGYAMAELENQAEISSIDLKK